MASRRRQQRLLAACGFLWLLVSLPAGASEVEPGPPGQTAPPPAPRSRLYLDADWPDGILYEVRKASPSLSAAGPLAYFDDVYLIGRVGLRLDLDAAFFAAAASLRDFEDDVAVRRARFYLIGNFQLGLPLAYKFEFSVEGTNVFVNDFFLRWKPKRWVDSVDLGYLTPPMGLENIVSSRSLSLMEMSAPIQALAPGYRSGISMAGHWEPWRFAWKGGFYSAGQEQISGDASSTSAQLVGRMAWRPWFEPMDPGAPFVHLGISGSYVFSGDGNIRYRARPESFIAPFVVDTGELPARAAVQYALEAAWNKGPWLLSFESLQSSVIDADDHKGHVRGAYALVSWMLTGESHPYNSALGIFERLKPRQPFSFQSKGWGAFEMAQRVSWLDLSTGRVRGGELLTLASGVTWHLNAELRLSANYVFAHVADGPQNGEANIFQMRLEIGI